MSLSACCLAGRTPEGTPAGKCQEIAGVPCYVADSTSQLNNQSQPSILIAPDVFGASVHCKLLADDLNQRSGWPVVLVDYFRGSAMPISIMDRALPLMLSAPDQPAPSFWQKLIKIPKIISIIVTVMPLLVPFFFRHMGRGKAKVKDKFPMVAGVANSLRGGSATSLQRRPLGIMGYCYGGAFSLHFGCADTSEERLFDAVGVAHGEVELAQVETLKTPALFVCADKDHAFPEERIVQAEKLVQQREPSRIGSDANIRFNRYPGTYHGFCIRGDERSAVIQAAKAKAVLDCLDFFKASFAKT